MKFFDLLFVVLRDFLLISVSIKFSNNLLRSRLSGMFYKVLQYSIPECSSKFYNILLDNSSAFKKVPDCSFSY